MNKLPPAAPLVGALLLSILATLATAEEKNHPGPKPHEVSACAAATEGAEAIRTLAPLLTPGETPRLQAGRDPTNFNPEEPLDLGGDMPADEDVAAAIKKAVEYLLGQQKSNGSWDAVLTGELLSQTADQAVDSVAATALCGLALRPHAAVAPEGVEAALKRAADFIMDRIIRGKLSTRIWYANWRYTLGLKFLTGEYLVTTDEERRAEFAAVARRMVNALMQMQLTNGEANLLDRKARAKLSTRAKKMARPGDLGLVLMLPTDDDYRGGALVVAMVPDGPAEKAGIQVGDRIVEAEGLRIENAVDYYLQEVEWLRGQKVTLKVKTTEGKVEKRTAGIPLDWPGYAGVSLKGDPEDAPVVAGFQRFSPAAESGLQESDIIQAVGSTKVANHAEYLAEIAALAPGKRVRLRVTRDGKSKSFSFEIAAAPEGHLGFYVEEEDKEGEAGVLVAGDTIPGTPAAELGLRAGDRVTHIGHIPITGLDHYIGLWGAQPAGIPVYVRWLRGGKALDAWVAPMPVMVRGVMGISLDAQGPQSPNKIKSVTKDSPADKAGLREGDVITAINGQATPRYRDLAGVLGQYAAGEEIVVTVQRGNKSIDIKVTLGREGDMDVEEGGWAYYPNQGKSPSFATAAALLALYQVEEVMEIEVPRASTKAAEKLIENLRFPDPDHGGATGYVYSDGAQNAANFAGKDIRGHMGRLMICELALMRAKKRSAAQVKKSLENWVKHREELDRVRTYTFTHYYPLYANAAYYWMFGHYHSLLAAREVGGKAYDEVRDICVKALMLTRRPNGTWLGHSSFGELCGTAQALMILGQCDGGYRVQGSPTTDGK